jgi:orotate phosphoribosyltransferase
MKLDLLKSLLVIGAIKFGEFTLKDGRKSPYYIDLRILPSYPKVLIQVSRLIEELISSSPERPTCLCGIPAAGLAIASAIGIRRGIRMIYTRKEPIIYRDLIKKIDEIAARCGAFEREGLRRAISILEELGGFKTHGIARWVEGELRMGDKIALIDDLIASGESKLEAIDLIQREAKRRGINVEILGAFVLLDREEGGKENLEKRGINLHPVLRIREAASLLHESGLLSKRMHDLIVSYTLEQRKRLGLDQ